MLDFDDFELALAACELRYEHNFRHWDTVGKVWSEMSNRYPDLRLVQGTPEETRFRVGFQYELAVRLDRFALRARKPDRKLQDFTERLSGFYETVQDHLQISYFSRIGLRLIWRNPFEDNASASQAVLDTGLVTPPSHPNFGIEGRLSLARFDIKKEDGSKGYAARVFSETSTYDFDPPFDWRGVEPKPVTRHDVVLDIDYFASGTVSHEQLRIKDWILQALHLINRDAKQFLGAKK